MPTQTTDLELRIKTALEGIEGLTGFGRDLTATGEAADGLTQSADKLDSALNELAGISQQIQAHKDLEARLAASSAALDKAAERQRALSADVVSSFDATAKQIKEQERADAAVDKASAALEKQRDRVRELAERMDAAEQPTARLSKSYDTARTRLDALTQKLTEAKARQEAANKAVAEGGEPSARLAREHEKATEAVESLTKQVALEKNLLEQNAKALQANGIATNDLDGAQKKIAQTFGEVNAKAREFAEAQAKLKFIPKAQLEAEAKGLRDAYETLRSSGKLSAEDLRQASQKLDAELKNLSGSTQNWQQSLSGAKIEIGKAVAAFAPIAVSVKQAADFETALAGVRKVTGGTDEQMAGLAARLREMTRELPIGASGLADIAAAGGQLGIPIQNLDTFVALAAKIGTAFDISADEAGKAVATLANVFDLPLEGVNRLAGSINELSNSTAATAPQILDFAARVGGTARQFGLSAESVSALGASLIEMGRTPEVAATAVAALLTRLQAANVMAPKAQRALQGIGLSAVDLAQQIQENPQKALETFLGTLEGLNAQARTEAIAQILGLQHADKIASLVGNIEGYRKNLKLANDEQRASASLNKEFAAQMDTTAQQFKLLKNSISETLQTIGEQFLPVVRAGISAGKSFAEAIADVVKAAPGLSTVAVTLASVAVGWKGLAAAGTAAGIMFKGLVPSILSSTTALGAMGTTAKTAGGQVAAGAGVATTAINALRAALNRIPLIFAMTIALEGAGRVIAGINGVRDAYAQLERAEQDLQEELQKGIDDANKRIAQYSGQAQGVGAAIEGVSQGIESLTDAQKIHYQGALKAGEENLKALIARTLAEQQLNRQSEQSLESLEQQLGKVRAAREELQASIDAGKPITADQVIDVGVLAAVDDLRDRLGQASSKELSELRIQAKEAFAVLDERIQTVRDRYPELSAAAREAIIAMDPDAAGLIDAYKKLGGAIQDVTNEQLKRLGVDASEVLTGIDSKAQELLDSFRDLAQNPEIRPELLTAAFGNLLKKLDSPQELTALQTILRDTGAVGDAAFAQIAARADSLLGNAAKSTAGGAQSIASGLQALGGTVQQLSPIFTQMGEDGTRAFSDTGVAAEKLGASARASLSTINGMSPVLSAAGDGYRLYASEILRAAAAEGDAAFKRERNRLLDQAGNQLQVDILGELRQAYEKSGAAGLDFGEKASTGAMQAAQGVKESSAKIDASVKAVDSGLQAASKSTVQYGDALSQTAEQAGAAQKTSAEFVAVAEDGTRVFGDSAMQVQALAGGTEAVADATAVAAASARQLTDELGGNTVDAYRSANAAGRIFADAQTQQLAGIRAQLDSTAGAYEAMSTRAIEAASSTIQTTRTLVAELSGLSGIMEGIVNGYGRMAAAAEASADRQAAAMHRVTAAAREALAAINAVKAA